MAKTELIRKKKYDDNGKQKGVNRGQERGEFCTFKGY